MRSKLKTLLSALILSAIPVLTHASVDLSEFDLVFSDEFNSSSLDSTKWSTRHLWGSFTPINGEEQYYIDTEGFDNGYAYTPFLFTGDSLIIQADEVSSSTPLPDQPPANSSHWQNNPDFQYNDNWDPSYHNYYSGLISSSQSFNFTHGYVETRAKLPPGQGLWSAFWLLTSKYVEDVPEIDIMEALGHAPNEVNHTYHYFDVQNNWQLISTPTFKTTGPDYTNEFHTYGVLWEPRKITWFVDGQAVKEITDEDYRIAKQSMYIIANLAVGGTWPGSPDTTTNFPAQYEIDYIRAYKRKPESVITPQVLASEYQLMFSDEFSGNELDATKWNTSYLWGPYFRINNEEQLYIDSLGRHQSSSIVPLEVSSGSLKIHAQPASASELPDQPGPNHPEWQTYNSHQYNPDYKQPGGWTPSYTSGLLTSYDSFKFVNGYIEARIKVPEGSGLWPAFWLLNGYYVGPQPEIDIMELQGGSPSSAHHSYHYFNTDGELVSSANTSTLNNNESFADDFHVFGLQWDKDKITWYVDGVKTRTLSGPTVSSQLMYVLLNLAVGGNFVSDVDANALPATMEVDYVRAYQRNSVNLDQPQDTVAPTVIIDSPVTDGESLLSSPTLTGRIIDNAQSDLTSIEVNIRDTNNQVWVRLDGTPTGTKSWVRHFLETLTPNQGETNWELDTTLPNGDYYIQVRATDASGNLSGWTKRYFTVGIADTIAPSPTIDVPAADTTMVNSSPVFMGNITDNEPYTLSSIELNIRDLENQVFVRLDGTPTDTNSWVRHFVTPSTPTSNSTNWSLPTALPNGRYFVQIRATDKAGNRSAWTKRFFSVGSADLIAPTATIELPASDQQILEESPVLSGSFTDNALPELTSIELNIRDTNQQAWVRLDGTPTATRSWVRHFITPGNPIDGRTNWSVDSDLPIGNYYLQIRATDAAGNRSGWSRRSFSIGVTDNTPPLPAIDSPSSTLDTLNPSPSLHGYIVDDNSIQLQTIEVNIRDVENQVFVKLDGTPTTTNSWVRHFIEPELSVNGATDWAINTSLPAGKYFVQIRATDAAGNQSGWLRRTFFVE